MVNQTKEKIYNFIKEKKDEPVTIKDIIEALNISYPTIAKWLAVIEAEQKVMVSDYGNIKFYYASKDEAK